MRLDKHLTGLFPGFSRNIIQKFITDKGVRVNDTSTKKPHYSVPELASIELREEDLQLFVRMYELSHSETITGEKPTALYDCVDFVAYDKPPFRTSESIVNGLFPVHRLDKNTSGVLVVAKSLQAQYQLQKQWQDRVVQKCYIALLKGRLAPKKGAIDAPIARSMNDRKKMAISSRPHARKSYTEYEVDGYFTIKGVTGAFTLVRAFPKTGRTHQIRIHFQSIGFPVVGDSVYGDLSLNKEIYEKTRLNRQFLHAFQLTLQAPQLELKSVLPKDLQKCVDHLVLV